MTQSSTAQVVISATVVIRIFHNETRYGVEFSESLRFKLFDHVQCAKICMVKLDLLV